MNKVLEIPFNKWLLCFEKSPVAALERNFPAFEKFYNYLFKQDYDAYSYKFS